MGHKFVNRGYPFSTAFPLLDPRPRTPITNRMVFVNTYHPYQTLIRDILKVHWPLLSRSYPGITDFQQPVMICNKRPPNLRDRYAYLYPDYYPLVPWYTAIPRYTDHIKLGHKPHLSESREFSHIVLVNRTMAAINIFMCLFLVSNYCLLTVSQAQSPVAQGYDCSNIWERNHTATSGIYMIKPRNAQFGFQVYCEMSGSGGWTLIQNHNGEDHLDFYATWIEYENGFGRLQGEHWLGLKNMYALTHQTQRRCKLHISLGDFDGNEAYAEYRSFSIGEANKFYKLSAANYSGTAGDAFLGFPDIPGSNQHGSYFSTWDNYHDKCHPLCGSSDIKYRSCSDQYGAGWWFNACGLANLNGVWHAAPDYQHWSTSVSWPSWRFTDSLKFSKMFLIHY
ncbi:fibrinogen-like protein 1 [Phyllobates terribilis]|uniref:fibrinogen-like protein 1 n=1 Tax=Phyllobates terribilis TaxID=111132 RepID=UPI003CCA9662